MEPIERVDAPVAVGVATGLPSGTATFLFTDIQGSTDLVQRLDLDRWREILATHHHLLREQWSAFDGQEVKTEGDAFFVVFERAPQAVAACVSAQKALAAYPWPADALIRVRMGLHAGEAHLVGQNDYIGLDVHRAARIVSTAHGGQVVISESTRVLVGDDLPAGVTVVDLGEHRLKDLTRAEHLYQLAIEGLNSEFPALKTLDAVANNLPTQLTSFVGRESELAEGRRLLERTHLLTLVGTGGTGKTRLGLQIAAEATDMFRDGVYFAPLAQVSDPALVASAVATAVGVPDVGKRDPLDALVAHLKDRELLLLLDNFEQVMPAAEVVSRLLKEAPDVKVIVTSRSPLRLSGEQEFPVAPLALPDVTGEHDVDELSSYESVRLFIERACAVKPDFQASSENIKAVARICALVDGLPLAIELAAARVRLFAPETILARLGSSLADLSGGARDLPERQRTLRGAISWSYDLLGDEARALMARFAVFVGGGSLGDIDSVCGEVDSSRIDVLAGLESLVEQNLARPRDGDGEPRFFMLHVIREFALEQLEASGQMAAISTRHAATFLGHAEEAMPHLAAADSRTWLDRLETDHDNIRAALAHLLAEGRAEEALRMAASLWRFWQRRGHLVEGRERVQDVLAMPGGDGLPLARMRALEAAGGIAWWQGDVNSSIAFYEQSLELARAAGTPSDLANALYNLGFPLGGTPDGVDRAMELDREALSLFEEVGDRGGAARTGFAMARIFAGWKRYDEARELAEGAAAAFRELDLRFDLIWALHLFGLTQIHLEQFDRARESLTEGFSLLADSGDLSGYPIFLGDFSDLALAVGDAERGVRLKGASSAIQSLTGAGVEDAARSAFLARQALGGELDDAQVQALLDEGRAMSPDEALAYALRFDES